MNVLLFSPHADDELLGAGGTLMRMKEDGYKIKCVLVASDGRISTERNKEFENVCKIISTEEPEILGFPDMRLDTVSIVDIISKFDCIIKDFNPDIVLIPEPSYHQDHQVVNKAAIAALRPYNRQPLKILLYEVPTSMWHSSELSFTPNVYYDITKNIFEKSRIFDECYTSQAREFFRNKAGVEAQGRYRGHESGSQFAEAFYLLKEINR